MHVTGWLDVDRTGRLDAVVATPGLASAADY